MTATENKKRPAFDPMAHARKMKLRGNMVDYLPASAKVHFLNYCYPGATIIVEPVNVTAEYAAVKATITLPNGATASALGGVFKKDFADYIEKADTRAVARCCTRLGFDINGIYDTFAEGYVPLGDEEDFVPADAEVIDEPGETSASSSENAHSSEGLPLNNDIEENDTEQFNALWTSFVPENFSYVKDKGRIDEVDASLLRDEMHNGGFSAQGFLRYLYFLEEDAYKNKTIKTKPKARQSLTDIPQRLFDEVMEWLVNGLTEAKS